MEVGEILIFNLEVARILAGRQAGRAGRQGTVMTIISQKIQLLILTPTGSEDFPSIWPFVSKVK